MFRIPNSKSNDVDLLGIHWGRFTAPNGQTYSVYSPISRIYLDLSSTDDIWDACAPGFGC